MGHYLRKNHESRIPSHHVCVDTETIPVLSGEHRSESHHRLMLGCAAAWRYRAGGTTSIARLDFRHREEWWEWLYARGIKGRRVWVWAHNAAFDFTTLGLWQELSAGRIRLRSMPDAERDGGDDRSGCRQSPPSLVTSPFCFLADCVTDAGASFRFVGSENFAPLALAKLGAMIGLGKLPMPGESGSDEDWFAYCRRDVDILAQVVDRLCGLMRTHDLGNMQWTGGGQAMSHYRHRHLSVDIFAGPDEVIRPMERRAYYGARQTVYFRGTVQASGTEVFVPVRSGTQGQAAHHTENVYRLDCNQCYPFVMREHRYPSRVFRRFGEIPVEQLRDVMVHYEAVAEVRLFAEVEPYPVRQRGMTTWRMGSVCTTLCGPELRRAIDSGHVVHVYGAQTYVSHPLFKTWAEEVMQWRAESTDAGDAFASSLLKRIANSLHGKFGQSGRRWESAPHVKPPVDWGLFSHRKEGCREILQCRAIAGTAQVLKTEDEAQGSCPVIAAFVTAYAREHLRAARMAAGPRHTLYEDADSLHVDERGYRSLDLAGWIHPTRPGAFKVEAVAQVAEYRSIKNYTIGDLAVICGRSDKGEIDAKGLWHQTEWIRLDSLLAGGMPDSPITVEREVGPITPDDRECYGADGWIVYRRGL